MLGYPGFPGKKAVKWVYNVVVIAVVNELVVK